MATPLLTIKLYIAPPRAARIGGFGARQPRLYRDQRGPRRRPPS